MKLFRTALAGFTATSALAMATPAQADWIEVQSTNFRYFSTDSADDARERVANLEKLDQIVRQVTGNTQPPGELRLTVFEVPTMRDVQETLPGSPRGVGAYYTTSNEGAHVVTFHRPVRAPSGGGRIKRTYRIQNEVTQHEYLHHLMFQYFPTNYPTFYPEGFAEYYGSIQFEDDDVIVVGHAPVGRLEAMRDWLPVREMLTAKSYGDVDNLGGLYAQGWLLTHMAAARPEVGRQLQTFLRLATQGVAYDEAAEQAFGDLEAFDRQLRAYKDEVTALTIKLDGLDIGPISVRELSPVEEKMVPIELKLRSSFKMSEFSGLASRARSAVRNDPDDAYGQGTLALLEFHAGDLVAAEAAARRAVSLDPASPRGNRILGDLAILKLAETGSADTDAWEEARAYYLQAIQENRTETSAMIAYFQSFEKQGILPSPAAQNLLFRAFTLTPRNDDVRYMLAADFEKRGMIDEAIAMISPLAYGSLDGAENDEEERAEQEEELRKQAEKYYNVMFRESAREMLKRLQSAGNDVTDQVEPEADNQAG